MENGFSLRPKNARYMWMKLIDRVAAPQRIPAEPRAHLVQRGIYVRRPDARRRAVLAAAFGGAPIEQAQLRSRAQVRQDHPQQPKFRTGVLGKPARKQFPGDVAQRALL